MNASSLLQSALLQPPQQDVESVLAEKRFASESRGWHTPMTARLKRRLVFLRDGFVLVRIVHDLAIESSEVDSGACCGIGQMRTVMPVVDRAGPDAVTDFPQERQPASRLGRGTPEPRETMDVRL